MMCAKLLKRSGPKRILVISQTNIGDVVLTCPVIDILRHDFPAAKMDVVVGPKAASLFEGNPDLQIKVFDKQAPLRQKFVWFQDLVMGHYDCVVDLRRTMLPLLLMPRYSTPTIKTSLPQAHKKEMHLNRLRQVYDFETLSPSRYAVVTTQDDEKFFESQLSLFLQGKSFVVIAPGAADGAKRWGIKGFTAVADHLATTQRIVFVGDNNDAQIIKGIQAGMKGPSLSLGGSIHLRQLAFVLKKSSWALTHDSGVMHLASYFNVPLVVLWGPTSLEKYAPWSKRSVVVKRNEKCARCKEPKSDVPHNCMSFIEVDDVIKAIKTINENP